MNGEIEKTFIIYKLILKHILGHTENQIKQVSLVDVESDLIFEEILKEMLKWILWNL